MARSRLASLAAVSLALAASACAAPILYYTPAETSAGLGKPNSHQLTTAITDAFGAGNVIELPSFADASAFADGSALFVNARGQNPDALSAAERTNLLSFIDAGGAVFFVGDHASWQTWDNSFLSLFGDEFAPWGYSVGAAYATGALPTLFTPGSRVLLTAPGAIAGGHGTPLYRLFNNNTGPVMAATYGPNANAIAFLDTNGLVGFSTEHLALYDSIASWLHATGSAYEASRAGGGSGGSAVPEGGVGVGLAAVVLGLIAGQRWRAARATAS